MNTVFRRDIPIKKSEAYKLAQIAVINTPTIAPESKIAILKFLINDEELAAYREEMESEEK